MEIVRTAKPLRKFADLDIWHCASCSAVHLAFGESVVNLSREEFSRFAGLVVEIECNGWTRGNSDHSIVDLIAREKTTAVASH